MWTHNDDTVNQPVPHCAALRCAQYVHGRLRHDTAAARTKGAAMDKLTERNALRVADHGRCIQIFISDFSFISHLTFAWSFSCLSLSLSAELARLPANESAGTDVEAVRDWLVVAEARMAALTAATEKFVTCNASGVQELSRVSSMLHANYVVEKEFVSSPPPSLVARGAITPRVDIADSVAAWGLSLKWTNNAYDELLLGPLHYELQDIQAMSEAVKARGELAARHAKSVKTAAKWAAPGSAPKNEVRPHGAGRVNDGARVDVAA